MRQHYWSPVALLFGVCDMANINLLPWRENNRVRNNKRYQLVLITVACFGVMVSYLFNQYFESRITRQFIRNQFIKSEGLKLDDKFVEIRKLRETREQLIERMQLIQDLQGNRPIIVRIFDELVHVTPDALYLTSIKLVDSKISLHGNAESNSYVSELMRNIENSKWFSDANLIRVNQDNLGLNSFDIVLNKVEPNVDNESE